MTPAGEARIDAAELEQVVQAAEPAAFLVAPRVLRRVIRSDRKLAGIGLDVPHRKSYTISREALRPLVDKQELGLRPDANLPAVAILLERPDTETLAKRSRADLLMSYWRMLFHAHVHLALERRLTEAGLGQRIHQIGRTEFDEIRAVLRQDRLLLPPRDERTVYIEFAAVYLELRRFAPQLLPRYFPALQSYDAIDAVLAEDVDAARLFAGTRPAGAPEPCPHFAGEEPSATETPPAPAHYFTDRAKYEQLQLKAGRAASAGNSVRAIILQTRAARVNDAALAEQALASAATELAHLADRLGQALQQDEATAAHWRDALTPLLPWAAQAVYNTEARLLYDLQKICIDQEREVYAVDLAGWLWSLGRRPVRRLLIYQPDVLALKHLRSAARRLRSARLDSARRAPLAGLIDGAIHDGEARLRARLHPVLVEALTQVGMRPSCFAEEIALNQLSEELLDVIAARGYLTMSHLRDAVSRNGLKLPDLAGPLELLRGNRLLQADRRLDYDLDGIYHPGEVYLRWLQRFSLAAFGTQVGRRLTLYLALPFGGAFVILFGLYHLIVDLGKLMLQVPDDEAHHFEAQLPAALHAMESPATIGLLGVFLFLTLHVAAFRRGVVYVLRRVGQAARLLLELPSSLLNWPPLRALLKSRFIAFVYHYALKPLALTLPAWAYLRWRGAPNDTAGVGGVLIFLVVNVLLNSRLGRDLEETAADWLMTSWRRLLADILPGMVRYILDFFRWIVESVDRFLYAADEWLRFRGGERQWLLALKAMLGLFWFVVTYVVRFAINLLIEPQINPIKHFPVVTVSHKLLLPFIPTLAGILKVTMDEGLAWTVATLVIAGIPGIFGFLVWELKENWRLFEANRPETLQPVAIGHHGETMLRFLRPGFHSGTLPKLFTRLRRAERRALRTGNMKATRKGREALHELEESIRRFVERNLPAVLNRCRDWNGAPIHAGAIALGSNRVRIELCCPAFIGPSMTIAFEEQSGWLLAEVVDPGWLPQLSPEAQQVFRTALAGFYKYAGVDLVREQVETRLGVKRGSYDIDEEGLIVWTGAKDADEAVYDLRAAPAIAPRLRTGVAPLSLPTVPAATLLFRHVPIDWRTWIEVWEREQSGKGVPETFLAEVSLLPPASGRLALKR